MQNGGENTQKKRPTDHHVNDHYRVTGSNARRSDVNAILIRARTRSMSRRMAILRRNVWKPTIRRTRHAPRRAPSQPQPWPAYEQPEDTTSY